MDTYVEIVEVAPRDGLQNEKTPFSTAQKVELITRSIAAGARRIEVTSFVNPRVVPQMADADDVMRALAGMQDVIDAKNVSLIGLVLNERGLERAVASGVHEINFAFAATETFNGRNQRATVSESLTVSERLAKAAHDAGLKFTATIGAFFGCPFEGEVPIEHLKPTVAQLVNAGIDELTVADTIGVATPSDVTARLGTVQSIAGHNFALRCHFHDTRNTGLANAQAALAAGVTTLDTSLGGLGGCPFAPGATGNLATEDLLYLIDRGPYRSDLDPQTTLRNADWLKGVLQRPVNSSLSRSGWFPNGLVEEQETEAGKHD